MAKASTEDDMAEAIVILFFSCAFLSLQAPWVTFKSLQFLPLWIRIQQLQFQSPTPQIMHMLLKLLVYSSISSSRILYAFRPKIGLAIPVLEPAVKLHTLLLQLLLFLGTYSFELNFQLKVSDFKFHHELPIQVNNFNKHLLPYFLPACTVIYLFIIFTFNNFSIFLILKT